MSYDNFNTVEDALNQGLYKNIILPVPLNDIVIIYKPTGYNNFSITITEQVITGDAMIVTYRDGKYNSFSHGDYKRLMDSEDIVFNFVAVGILSAHNFGQKEGFR